MRLQTTDCLANVFVACKAAKIRTYSSHTICRLIVMETIMEYQVITAITALKKYVSDPKRKTAMSNLFSDHIVHAEFSLKRLPPIPAKQKRAIQARLPHAYRNKDSCSICLITKDIDIMQKGDTEKSVAHFKELLTSQHVSCIDKIIPMEEVKTEYKTFEARRKWCSAYDVFLIDSRITNLVSEYLGNCFMQTNKFPFSISLTHGNINNQIDKCLSTTRSYYSCSTPRCAIKFGCLDQSLDHLVENYRVLIENIDRKLLGGIENVRTISISIPGVPLLPVYASAGSANLVRFPDRIEKSQNKPVIDEFDFCGGAYGDDGEGSSKKIKVWPQGHVKIMTNDKDSKRSNKRKRPAVWISKRSQSKKRRPASGNENNKSLKPAPPKSVPFDRYHSVKKEVKQETDAPTETKPVIKVETID